VRAVIGGGISWSLDRRETRAVAQGVAGRSLTGPPLAGTVRRKGSTRVGVGCPYR
jgi:hypothetical protein